MFLDYSYTYGLKVAWGLDWMLLYILFFSVSYIFFNFYSFFKFGVDKRQMRAIMNI